MIVKERGFGWDVYPFEETSGIIIRVMPNDGEICRIQLLEAVPGQYAHPDWWREVVAALEKARELAYQMNDRLEKITKDGE